MGLPASCMFLPKELAVVGKELWSARVVRLKGSISIKVQYLKRIQAWKSNGWHTWSVMVGGHHLKDKGAVDADWD